MPFFHRNDRTPKPLTLAVFGATAPEIESLRAEFAATHPGRPLDVHDCTLHEFQAAETGRDLLKIRFFRPDNSVIDASPGRGFAVIDGGRQDIAAPFRSVGIAPREDAALFGQRLNLF